MYTVTWFWVDRTMEQYKTETKEQAEAMAAQIKTNPQILYVIIDDGNCNK